MNTTLTGEAILWYAAGIGNVKTKNFDAKNKLIGNTVLAEFKGKRSFFR
ncbi:MAG: hypothetical protein LBV17_01635 [Treponema sp.]|jgi:hypothetical protein|nr:hypothetical protein [Treponema sp.]